LNVIADGEMLIVGLGSPNIQYGIDW